MAKKRGVARGLEIGRKSLLMSEKAKEAKPSSKVWEEEFERGTANWRYHMRLNLPYVNYVSVHPNLTEEQRMIAVKEYWRRWREGLPSFMASCADESVRFAMGLVVRVPARSSKPSMGVEGGLLV